MDALASLKASNNPHFEARSTLSGGALLPLFIRSHKSSRIIEDTAHAKLCGAHAHLWRRLCVMLLSYSTQQALQFWLTRRRDLGFVCHTDWPVSNQPQTYLLTEESSKLRNVVLIPWVSNKGCVRGFTQVQRSVSCSVWRGILLRIHWSSLWAIRGQYIGAPKKRSMWSWPLNEEELDKPPKECPYKQISRTVVPPTQDKG